MPSPISGIAPATVAPVRLPAAAPPSADKQANPFESVLADAVQRVENYRATADTAVQRYLSGEDEEVHKVAMATQQAELNFELFLQVKNKVVQAYQEIMRMQM